MSYESRTKNALLNNAVKTGMWQDPVICNLYM